MSESFEYVGPGRENLHQFPPILLWRHALSSNIMTLCSQTSYKRHSRGFRYFMWIAAVLRLFQQNRLICSTSGSQSTACMREECATSSSCCRWPWASHTNPHPPLAYTTLRQHAKCGGHWPRKSCHLTLHPLTWLFRKSGVGARERCTKTSGANQQQQSKAKFNSSNRWDKKKHVHNLLEKYSNWDKLNGWKKTREREQNDVNISKKW